jgi:uncharacterized protein YggE
MVSCRYSLVPATIAVLAMFVAAAPVSAQGTLRSENTVPSITVSGEASVRVAPDLAILHAGATNVAKTAAEASAANAKAVMALLAALKDAGVPEKDIQTGRYSLFPQQDHKGKGAPRIVGFQASNNLTIRLTDISKIDAVLDALVKAGANDIGGIEFQVTGRSKALDEARAKAFADAKRKASIYARAAEVELGRVLLITEAGAGPGPIAMRAMASPSAPPVATGEQMLRVGTTVVFELVR